jgi:hypothetical protein
MSELNENCAHMSKAKTRKVVYARGSQLEQKSWVLSRKPSVLNLQGAENKFFSNVNVWLGNNYTTINYYYYYKKWSHKYRLDSSSGCLDVFAKCKSYPAS